MNQQFKISSTPSPSTTSSTSMPSSTPASTTTSSTTTSTSAPTTTSSTTTPAPSTSSSTTSSTTTPAPSTSSSTTSSPSIYDTNNNMYNFPLLHGGNGKISGFFKHFNLTAGVLIVFLVVVIIFVFLFSSLGKSESTENSSNSSWFGTNTTGSENGGAGKSHIIKIIIIVLIVVVLSVIYRHFEGTGIIGTIKNLFTKSPQVNVTATKPPPQPSPQPSNNNVPEIKLYKEVFNIPGNNYTYSEAESICSAYGAKLATYDELEHAYNRGGEWCNYGWSEGQMALFPTQKKTYNKLQSIKGHEHDCGRPGINGGYIANPNVRFGINCYGNKPKRTETEKELMENTTPYPLTKEEIIMEKQVDYWKTQLPNIIVSPFNTNRWSKI